MTTATVTVTNVIDTKTAKRLVGQVAGEAVSSLDEVVEEAVQGSWRAVHDYVQAYRALTSSLLGAVNDVRPDLVLFDEGHYLIVDAKGKFSRAGAAVLERASIQAPFSPWVGIAGNGTGVALEVVSRLRALIIQLDPLPLPKGKSALLFSNLDELDIRRFTRLVMQELDGDQPPLWRISEVFDLNTTELGRLFGVSRQAAAQWLDEGVPSARQAKAATVAAIADIVDQRLKRSRIAGIARRPAEAYGGQTMLELIAADKHDWLLESVRESFDYAATA
jgi:hypothetical protein